MPFGLTASHSTAADSTFSAAGAAAWAASHPVSVAGADVGGIPYAPTATSLVTNSAFTFDGTTGLAVTLPISGLTLTLTGSAGVAGVFAGGTATTNVQCITASQTWNNAGVNFIGYQYKVTDTASGGGSLHSKWLGGAAGSTVLMSLDNLGGLVTATGYTAGGAISSATFSITGHLAMNTAGVRIASGDIYGASSAADNSTASDVAWSRTGAGEFSCGNGTAGNTTGTVRAAAYKVGSTAGASFGPGMPTSVTFVNGILTAAS